MNIFLSLILVTQLYGGFMETELAKGIVLNTWTADGYSYAQICNNGKWGSKYITAASSQSAFDYTSVKMIRANFARVTYSDGTIKLLHIINGCITVIDEKEK